LTKATYHAPQQRAREFRCGARIKYLQLNLDMLAIEGFIRLTCTIRCYTKEVVLVCRAAKTAGNDVALLVNRGSISEGVLTVDSNQ